jgi:hypothetical protein
MELYSEETRDGACVGKGEVKNIGCNKTQIFEGTTCKRRAACCAMRHVYIALYRVKSVRNIKALIAK